MFLQEAYKILNEAPVTKLASRVFNKAAVTVRNTMTPKHIADYAKEVRGINNGNRTTLSMRDSPFMSKEFKKATLGADDRREFVDSVSGLNKDRKHAIKQKVEKTKNTVKTISQAIGGGLAGAGAVEGIKAIAKDEK